MQKIFQTDEQISKIQSGTKRQNGRGNTTDS